MGVWCKSIDGHTQLATTTPITAQILPLPFVCFRHQPPPCVGLLIFLGVGGSTKGVVLIFLVLSCS